MLTQRQLEIANMVAKGLSNAEIARRLDIAEKTVKYHTTNIYKDQGVQSRAGLIVKLWEEGVSNDEVSAFKDIFK